MNACIHCSRVRAERDELAERVRQLEEMIRDDSWMPAEWRLTTDEAIVLNVLVKRRLATRGAFMTALYGNDPEGGAHDKIVDVHLSRIRKKLAPHGVVITTIWGRGHQLDDATRQLIRNLQREAA